MVFSLRLCIGPIVACASLSIPSVERKTHNLELTERGHYFESWDAIICGHTRRRRSIEWRLGVMSMTSISEVRERAPSKAAVGAGT